MKNLNMKRSKRLTGMVCMMLSIFLLTMPLLGMAAAQDVSGNDAPACICDTKCSVETPNQECPVCKENADACKGQAAEPNTLPCFCEKKCTKGDHNTECPTCAADMDLCTAPPAGEPAACICTVLCQEGAVNPDCAVCQSDRAQCIGKAPDTSTEPEQPTEPDTPTEPEPPAEPEKCTCTDKCAAGAVNTGCEICKNDLTKCEGKEPEVVDPKFTISILAPDGWYTNRANVEIRIKDVNKTSWDTVEAKINSGGSWIDLTDDLVDKDKVSLEISENCTIYVTVTDKNGKSHTKNRYIEVFDREAPTIRAGIEGELLRVEASDDLSGVDKIYVCGNSFSKLNNGTLDIRLKDYADNYEQITIQATDRAGNKSRMTQLNNPYYEEPTPTEKPAETVQQNQSSKPVKPAQVQAASSGSTNHNAQSSNSGSNASGNGSNAGTNTGTNGGSNTASGTNGGSSNSQEKRKPLPLSRMARLPRREPAQCWMKLLARVTISSFTRSPPRPEMCSILSLTASGTTNNVYS